MKADFIQELIESEDVPGLLDWRTGWEVVVFELEDEPVRHPERSEGSPDAQLEILRRPFVAGAPQGMLRGSE